MNRLKHIVTLFVLLATALSGQVHKLGPRLTYVSQHPLKVKDEHYNIRKSAAARNVDVIVTVQNDVDKLRAEGFKVVSHIGHIAVVRCRVSEIDELARLPFVIYVENPLPNKPLLDESGPAVRSVKSRKELGITGRGSIVSIIDSGIDWLHHDFRHPDGSTRIKYVLDLSQSGSVYGGVLYTEQDINTALSTGTDLALTDGSGHGSHVTGIATGDGSNDEEYGIYAGMAPEADIIAVKATRDDEGSEFQIPDQIIALAFIDSIATVLDQPYVVNLSLGGHSGAHDGTAPMERIIDSLVGRGISGKAVVTVSGNSGDREIHAKASLSQDVTSADITFVANDYTPQSGTQNDRIIFDGWYGGDAKVGVKIITPNGNSYGPVLPGNVLDEETNEGAIYVWNGFYNTGDGDYEQGINPFNGDREFFIQIFDQNASQPPQAGEWTLRLSGVSGTVDVWIADASMPGGFVKGNVDHGKISIPGTAQNVITVGAFVTKRTWIDLDGNNLTYDPENETDIGDLADFSSNGPTRDGRIKPEVNAPGQIIASTKSSFADPSVKGSIFTPFNKEFPNALIAIGGEHGLSSGTSMAAPHVAGAIALIYEQHPQATASQIKDILTNSAHTDNQVGMAPNVDWGWGKLDIYAALKRLPGEEPPLNYSLADAFPNPFTSKVEIAFNLPVRESEEFTKITVFNALGQHIRTVAWERFSAGSYSRFWDGYDDEGRAVSSGIYFIRLNSGKFSRIKKVCFLGHTM